jgi:DNA-binding transcriptional LysR family regulator
MTMDTRELSKVDLNLLISLHVLLDERSVSRAAERLYITQPAMSKTLSRLRVLFDDALFTRSRQGMQPTPRALEIAGGLDDILGDISQLLGEGQFNPGSFKGEVTLALSEHIGVAVLPSLTRKLQELAPLLSIRVITRLDNQLEELALGNLDLAIHVKQAHYSADYRVEEIGGSPLAILVREEHPLAQGKITSQRLSQFPLIKLYVPDREQLEVEKRANSGMPLVGHKQGILEISALLTALEVLRQTDYFMPAPAYLLQQGNAAAGIKGRSMPEESTLTIDYALVSHKRTANSPLHNWLWDQITCTIADIRNSLERIARQRTTAGSTDPLQ